VVTAATDTPAALDPVIALVVVGLLAFVLRWAFRPHRSGRAWPGRRGDTGLLRPIAVVDTTAQANALRALLSDANVRSTIDAAPDGRIRLLVFPEDTDRAQDVVPPTA
jgi:hypothetical protein